MKALLPLVPFLLINACGPAPLEPHDDAGEPVAIVEPDAGTPGYMSPEHHNDAGNRHDVEPRDVSTVDVDPYADVWHCEGAFPIAYSCNAIDHGGENCMACTGGRQCCTE